MQLFLQTWLFISLYPTTISIDDYRLTEYFPVILSETIKVPRDGNAYMDPWKKKKIHHIPIIDIEIGKTRKQSFRVLVDTGESDTWIINETYECQNCGNKLITVPKYNGRHIVKEFEPFPCCYPSSKVIGRWALETVNIKGSNYAASMYFLAAFNLINIDVLSLSLASGLLGLAGFDSNIPVKPLMKHRSFIASLNGLVPTQISFYPNSPADTLCLIVGAFDRNIIRPGTAIELPTINFEISQKRHWTVEGDIMFSVNTVLRKVKLTFDTGASNYFWFPIEIFNDFMNGVGIKTGMKIRFSTKYPVFNCSEGIPPSLPNIFICFKESTDKQCLSLWGYDYVDRISETECVFKVGNYTDDLKTEVLLGLGVFKNYFVSYNYFTKKMIVGQPNRDYNGKNCKCCKNGEKKSFRKKVFSKWKKRL